MKVSDEFTRMGEKFGMEIARLVGDVFTRSMTVVDVDDSFAYCRIYDEDDALPVPLYYLNIPKGMLKITPKVDSMVLVGFVNRDQSSATILNVSEVDKIEMIVGETSLLLIEKDLIQFNGGSLGGLVIIGQLTERLNKLQSEIDNMQAKIGSHSHTYIDSVGSGATPTPRTTTGTNYVKTTFTRFADSDYENKKIKQ